MHPATSPASPGASYRAYIDGLRAVAILAVVGYHAGVPLVRGGFVGVDVFFVISGYLITGILVREIEKTGRIDFAAFFARRIRRLFPSLLLVLSCTLGLACLFLSPLRREVQETARAALAASLFSSNVYFAWWLKDYFGGPADFQPLLHTWSLSVEEQFYLIWPPILLGISRLSLGAGGDLRRRVRICVALIAIATFAASLILGKSRPDLVFFWMPFRAWELGLGAILAVWDPAVARRAEATGSALGFMGIAAIAVSFVITRSGSYFPAPLALIPAMGTFCVILGHKIAPGSAAPRWLSIRPLVYTGKLSYVLYLWHYPLISIGKLIFLEASLPRDLGIAAISFALAALTVKAFEDPIRFRVLPAVRDLRVIGAGIALIALSAGAAVGAGAWAKAIALGAKAPDSDADAHVASLDPALTRWSGDRDRLFLLGDSHAEHLLAGIVAWARSAEANVSLVPMPIAGCVPLPGVTPLRAGYAMVECPRVTERYFARLWAELPPRPPAPHGPGAGVVLALRWTMYLNQPNVSVYEPWQGSIDIGARDADAASALFTEKLRGLLSDLAARSVRALIVLSPPELRFDLGKCLLRLPADKCASTRAAHLDHQRRIRSIVTELAAEFPDGLKVFDPTDLFCPSEVCRVELDGAPLYLDSNHLNPRGSRYVGQRLAPLLRWVIGRE